MIKQTLFFACIYVSLTCAAPNDATGRIIGGELARAGQFPFAAAIYSTRADGNYFCTGTIINEQWILTSGQCTALSLSFTIRLGTTKLNEGTLAAADHFELAPGWSTDGFDNDIGLIKLRVPATYTEYIQPVNFLGDTNLPDYSNVVTFGWGQTSDSVAGLVNDLRYADLVTLTHSECEQMYGDQVTENTVCAVGEYNEGTCRGDLGSPLIHYGSRGTAYLVGVSSFISTQGCESTDPSGFTRIYPFRDWIRNITGA